MSTARRLDRTESPRRAASLGTDLLDRQPPLDLQAEIGVLGSVVLLPDVLDDVALIRSMHTSHSNHYNATLGMHTGSFAATRPSIGAWTSYGLGTPNRNLPSFLVLAPQMPYAGTQVWASDFLPGAHQGTRVVPGTEPVANLSPRVATPTRQQLELEALRVPRYVSIANHACPCGASLLVPFPKHGGRGFGFDCPRCSAPFVVRLAYATGAEYRAAIEHDSRPAKKRRRRGGGGGVL